MNAGAVPADALLRDARRWLWLALLPLLVLVLSLAVWQARTAAVSVRQHALRGLELHRTGFEAAPLAARRHLEQVQQAWTLGSRTDGAVLARALQPHEAGGYTLDGGGRDAPLQLLWPDARPPSPGRLDQAAQIGALWRLAHDQHGAFVASWSLEPDGAFQIHPWAPSSLLVQAQGVPSLAALGEGMQRWQVWQQAQVDANPLGEARWSRPSVDGAGAGLVASLSAPLRDGSGAVRAVVGVDVHLRELERRLGELSPGPWRAWVLDRRSGQVMADRQQPVVQEGRVDGNAAKRAALQRLEEATARLNPALRAHAQTAAPGLAEVDGQWVVLMPLRHAPWVVLMGVSRADFAWSLLAVLWPWLAVASGLALAGLIGHGLIARRLVLPMIEILGHLRLRAAGQASSPRLPARWSPWLGLVDRTVEAMRQAQALKSAIVDDAQAALVTTDAGGRVVEFNPAAERLLGCTRARALGQSVADLLVPPAHRQAHRDGMARLAQGAPARMLGRRVEMTVLHAQGHEIPVEMVLSRIDVEGIVHYSASMADLRERQAAQALILQQREALRQSEKLGAMGSLLAGVAHELNNPLAIAMGRSAMLEEQAAGSPLADEARRIREATDRCGRIVRTFLNMARARPGTRRAVSLNELAQGAIDLMQYALRSHGITLHLHLASDLPTVQADPDQLGQIVLNLVVNAQQALAERPQARELGLATGTEASGGPQAPGARVWLRVHDNGPGVPAELRASVFEPFFSTKPAGLGTGLGLSVSRSIAREHGGELQLEDRPGGASFLLSLPLGLSAGSAGPDGSPATVAPPSDAAPAATVLIVDDEVEVAELMRRILEGAGYDAICASSGEEALELLEMTRVDAVVSDLRMPEIDGASLLAELGSRWPALQRRMLFVTGDTLSEPARRFIGESGCPCLDKPFARDELLSATRKLLDAPAVPR